MGKKSQYSGDDYDDLTYGISDAREFLIPFCEITNLPFNHHAFTFFLVFLYIEKKIREIHRNLKSSTSKNLTSLLSNTTIESIGGGVIRMDLNFRI